MQPRDVRVFLLDALAAAESIVGLRNRLVHGYFAIEWSRIVALVEGEVDTLIRELRQLAE